MARKVRMLAGTLLSVLGALALACGSRSALVLGNDERATGGSAGTSSAGGSGGASSTGWALDTSSLGCHVLAVQDGVLVLTSNGIARLSLEGEVLWANRFTGPNGDGLFVGEGTSDGTTSLFVFLSHSLGDWTSESTLAKLSLLDGTVSWQRGLSGLAAYSTLSATKDGGVVLSNGGAVVWLDAGGSVKWQVSHPDAGNALATADGNVVTSAAGHIVKLNGVDGSPLWSKQYDKAKGSLVAETQGGIVLLAGENLLLEIDAAGTPKWQKTFGVGKTSLEYVLATTGDGFALAVGDYLLDFDANGALVWQTRMPGATGSTAFVSVSGLSDGGVASCAVSPGANYLFKLGPSGPEPGACALLSACSVAIEDTSFADAVDVPVELTPGSVTFSEGFLLNVTAETPSLAKVCSE